jgi:hypothetical protein
MLFSNSGNISGLIILFLGKAYFLPFKTPDFARSTTAEVWAATG